VVGAVALVSGAPLMVLSGMALLGIGNGGAQLSRYAAAELYPAASRGWALSTIVWAGTVGGVLGPNLMAPAAGVAQSVRIAPQAGIFVAATVVMAGAWLAAVALPRARHAPPGEVTAPGAPVRLATLARLPAVRIALGAMVAAQLDMVAVMTMTPLYLSMSGEGLAMIGGVLSVHILGMFALSPLSGKLADRFGGIPTIVCGVGVLGLATVLAAAAPAGGMLEAPALFFLGYGWNLCFVGGSSLLSRGLPEAAQARLQGAVDTLVWGSSALASLASGGLFAAAGYSVLAVVAGLAPAVLLVAIVAARRRPPGVSRPAPELTPGDGAGAEVPEARR
jgi:MFS family permease